MGEMKFSENINDLLKDLIEPSRDLWWPDDLLSITSSTTPSSTTFGSVYARLESNYERLRQLLNNTEHEKTLDSRYKFESSSDNFQRFHKSLGWKVNNQENNEIDGRKYLQNILPQDLHMLDDKEGHELQVEGNTAAAGSELDFKLNPTSPTVLGTSSMKPKKKRKKKPRKAFTSWLEFRDEEYQMDEYEDEDETETSGDNRRKRGINLEDYDYKEKQKRSPSSFRRGYSDQSSKDEYFDGDDEEEEEEEDDDDESMEGDIDPLKSEIESDGDEEGGEEEKSQSKEWKPNFFKLWRKKRSVEVHRHEDGRRIKGRNMRRKLHIKYKDQEQEPTHVNNVKLDLLEPKTAVKGDKIKDKPKNNHINVEVTTNIPHHGKRKGTFHTAGKVHKFRTKRHAPRPPWREELPELSSGDHTVSFNVEWIVKCECDKTCIGNLLTTTTGLPELNSEGEIILRRVHRTAPP